MKFSLLRVLCLVASFLAGQQMLYALTPGETALAQKLANTYWSWPDLTCDAPKRWLRFNADGTVNFGWNGFTDRWQLLDDYTVEFKTKRHVKSAHNFRFDPKVTVATEVNWNTSFGNTGYGAVFRKISGPPGAAAAAPPVSEPTAESALDILSREAPNASDWALAPLDDAVPVDIRRNLVLLREDLLDEGKRKPVAGPAAYAAASQLCDALMADLDERDKTLVHYGYRRDQAEANTVVDSQSLEASRSRKGNSWPQFAREKRQAAEIFRQQENAARFQKDLPKLEWSDRTAAQRRYLDFLYEKYREDYRDSVKASDPRQAAATSY